MARLLRLLTVVSFAGFVIAATLAFSVRAAPPGRPDGGGDAGQHSLSDLLGSPPDRDALAGSKAFGAPVTPPGFKGVGSIGGGTFVAPHARLDDVEVSGPQSREVVERLVRDRLGTHFGEEPCVFSTGDVRATLEVSSAGAVSALRLDPGDAGALRGMDCLSGRLRELVFPPQKKPSTLSLTLHLERAQVR
ncbi:MAG: hypothetical protein GQE15_13280 [Archangiaceae bacterium]|nr:hypothetical protein [Archangiaceae bacterium]